MKRSKKIIIYIATGVTVTLLQVARRFCKVRARESKKKVYVVIDNTFDFVSNAVENIMAASLLIGAFL